MTGVTGVEGTKGRRSGTGVRKSSWTTNEESRWSFSLFRGTGTGEGVDRSNPFDTNSNSFFPTHVCPYS